MLKNYSFFFHYNKPASKKAGKPIISIHFKKQCILVSNLICDVKTQGKIRKIQPFFVISGKASNIFVENNIAYIK